MKKGSTKTRHFARKGVIRHDAHLAKLSAALAGVGRGLLARGGGAGVIAAVQAMNHAIATYWQVAAAQT